MSKHYILRMGDGTNYKNSNKVLKKINKGDKLWFIKNKEISDIYNGKIIAVADFVSINDLGWDDEGNYCGVDIHYDNVYNLIDCNLFTGLDDQSSICEYDDKIEDGLLINLIVEYEYISKYSKITKNNTLHILFNHYFFTILGCSLFLEYLLLTFVFK